MATVSLAHIGRASRAVPDGVAALKQVAFRANHMAKNTTGSLQAIWYEIKNIAQSGLLKHCSAFVDSVIVCNGDATIGLTFNGGGRLHTKACCLDCAARQIILQQLTAALGLNSKAAGDQIE